MNNNDTLILADDNFATKEKAEIDFAKIRTKNRNHLISTQPSNFDGAQIKIDSKVILLAKKSYVGDILPVTGHA